MLMKRRALSLVLVGLSLCLLAGCRRKPPQTAPDVLPMSTESVATPEPTPAPSPEPAPAPTTPANPLDGDDIDAANAYARSQGLLGDVYYVYDSSDLSEEARQRLADNARFLQRYPRFDATIEGHCDERGTAEYNLALGERRAQAARGYLTAMGVDGARLRTISYGKERAV